MAVREITVKQLSKWYMAGLWSNDMIDEAVSKGKITSEEGEKIKKLKLKV